MNNVLRELVKKHFNLVEAPAVEEQVEAQVELSSVEETTEEVASEQIFGEIKTADGELTLTYEGEELVVGLPVFVITEDGNVPAPDGEHSLEGGVVIETEGGSIVEISTEEEELPEVADETEAGEYPKEEMSEETIEESVEENFEEEIIEEEGMEDEEIIKAIAETILPMIDEMKKEIEEMKSKFSATEEKVETFAKSPAADRTKAEIRNRNTTNNKVDYSPLNDSKKAQFERLLKIRNKK
jgi:uncharacterized protein YgiM (DUF1202 family)